MDFDTWRAEFMDLLVRSGLARIQATRYDDEYLSDARKHYDDGLSPGEACTVELMG